MQKSSLVCYVARLTPIFFFSRPPPPFFFAERCASCHDDKDVLLMKSHSLLSNQIMELKLQHEQERTHLLQQHNTEKDSLVQDHQREIASLEKQARSAMAQHQAQTQEWRKRDGQVCGLFFSISPCFAYLVCY